MVWINYVVKPEQRKLEDVLLACGYWDFEVTTGLLELVWNDRQNSRVFVKDRSKYTVAEGDYIWIPRKESVSTPVAPGGATNTIRLGPPPVSLWAASESGPLECKDEDVRLSFDQSIGQSGWMVATRFSNFADLGAKLAGGLRMPAWIGNKTLWGDKIQENQIHKLGICAHGNAGAIQINGGMLKYPDTSDPVWKDPAVLSKLTISQYRAQFQQLLWALAPGATVLFFCCLAGESQEGIELFRQISLEWQAKAITVVGFRSILFSDGSRQKRDGNHYVGARETHYANHRQGSGSSFRRVYDLDKYWDNIALLPWASERTYHALVARGGQIVKRGEPPSPQGMGPGVDVDDLRIYQGQ